MSLESPADWRPSASRLALEARARLLANIRDFFSSRLVLEVETPIVSSAGNTDPNIISFRTDSESTGYLRTSPEYPMKRLLAAGLGDIYELGRVFRDAESGQWHNTEFTLLEWYRRGMSYLELADEVIDLLRFCGKESFSSWLSERLSYRDLFLRHTGLDPLLAEDSDWEGLALERGIRAAKMDVQQWMDLFITHLIQPALDPETITVVYDYPPGQAALARVRQGDEPVAERFEVYLGQVELANGYQELGDETEQRRRFEKENSQRNIRGDDTMPIDERLLRSLDHGLPECSGVALGVDRLLMKLLELDSIQSVIAFPQDRA